MKKEVFPIVITGHIDHGKSTLIGRLLYETQSLPKEKLQEIRAVSKELGQDAGLAFFTDQLKEERERMMTIDTTQAFFNTRRRSYCIIDTPGHPEFLKNMITGASFAEAAVLVIDASEGMMDQTSRHLYVIQLIGIKQVIIVLNKMDLVNYEQGVFNRLEEKLSIFLKQLGMDTVIVLPVSAKENDNISARTVRAGWFKGPSLIEALDSLRISVPDTKKPLTLPVQDVYKIDGDEIIVGKISSGRVKPGQKIKIAPGLNEATISRCVTFGKNNRRLAQAGENVGIILKDYLAVKRGDVITGKESSLVAVTRFRGNVLWLSPLSLRIGAALTLACATQSCPCFVEKIEKRINTTTLEIIEENGTELKTNEAGKLLIKTERPILLAKFTFIEELGRFLIERDENILACGIVSGLASQG